MSSAERASSAQVGSAAGPEAGDGSAGSPTEGTASSIGLLTLGRFSTNIAYRMAYPFLAVVAHGLGSSVTTVGLVLSLREGSGVLVPAITRRMERLGYRSAVLACLAVVGMACVAAATPGLGIYAFAAGMVFIGLAKAGYDSAMGGWIGDRVPFAARGRVTGLTEVSWALSLLLGMPLLALAFDAWGIRAGFVLVAGLNVVVAVAQRRWVPADHPRPVHQRGRTRLRLDRSTLALFGGLSLMAGAMQLVIVVHGVWLQDHFGLSTTGLGLSSVVLGLAELTGAGLTVAFTDRLGKRRAMLSGLVPMAAAAVLLGRATPSAGAALGLLAIGVVGFETAFISALPLLSELNPRARAATLGRAFLWLTLARGLATLVATRLYEHAGMTAVGALSSAGTVVAACFWWRVVEP
jgi:predicted MFS family arabinose efflux permease